MENDKKFPEQEAPVKNNDNAYVKVGEDGNPQIPTTDDKQVDAGNSEHTTSLDKR